MQQLETAGNTWSYKQSGPSINPKTKLKFPTLDDLCGPGKYLEKKPICPSGGQYQMINGKDVRIDVTCSVHGSLNSNVR